MKTATCRVVVVGAALVIAGCSPKAEGPKRGPEDTVGNKGVIEITSPRNGDEVSMNVVVEGLIHVDDLGDRYPAIAVHPVQTELIWIQPRPMTVEKIDGEYRFRCRAYCGTAREGIGEDFELYALLPKRGSLKEGDRLDRLPEGVPVSLSVLVTRAR